MNEQRRIPLRDKPDRLDLSALTDSEKAEWQARVIAAINAEPDDDEWMTFVEAEMASWDDWTATGDASR